ncbi:hypothetical protein KP509_02G028500 [Ceratopteris richardii]|uniref:Pentatricopeptide repeat-containing protein n=1 Tax=Ceratopteris richardii TaxID=49495 RepID=A0A8T2VBD3_CERRI|nr:hypothetical protein KP509_02G028500 [Ceratopteris richardii]
MFEGKYLQLHDAIMIRMDRELGTAVGNALIDMYVKCVAPNAVTYVCCLIACGRIGDVEKGKEIHEEIVSKGLLETLALGNALVDMYANCGFLKRALEVFDILPKRDVISWNALMSGYVKYEYGIKALNCLAQMQIEGYLKSDQMFEGKYLQLHDAIMIRMDRELGTAVGNALIDMYLKCGLIRKAHEVFNRLPNQDVVSWTALIAGYAKHGDAMFALNCLDEMQLKGVAPNAVTYVCCLIACGRIGDVEKGKEIHEEIVSKGLLETLALGNALVDMYANCGFLKRALEVFDILPKRDVISWNALMSGYVKYEYGIKALNCLAQMQIEGSIQILALLFVA